MVSSRPASTVPACSAQLSYAALGLASHLAAVALTCAVRRVRDAEKIFPKETLRKAAQLGFGGVYVRVRNTTDRADTNNLGALVPCLHAVAWSGLT